MTRPSTGMNVISPLKVCLHPMMLFCSESQSALPKIHFNLGATELLAVGINTMFAKAVFSQGSLGSCTHNFIPLSAATQPCPPISDCF